MVGVNFKLGRQMHACVLYHQHCDQLEFKTTNMVMPHSEAGSLARIRNVCIRKMMVKQLKIIIVTKEVIKLPTI